MLEVLPGESGHLCSLWYRENTFSKEYKFLKYRSTNEEIDFFLEGE